MYSYLSWDTYRAAGKISHRLSAGQQTQWQDEEKSISHVVMDHRVSISKVKVDSAQSGKKRIMQRLQRNVIAGSKIEGKKRIESKCRLVDSCRCKDQFPRLPWAVAGRRKMRESVIVDGQQACGDDPAHLTSMGSSMI